MQWINKLSYVILCFLHRDQLYSLHDRYQSYADCAYHHLLKHPSLLMQAKKIHQMLAMENSKVTLEKLCTWLNSEIGSWIEALGITDIWGLIIT